MHKHTHSYTRVNIGVGKPCHAMAPEKIKRYIHIYMYKYIYILHDILIRIPCNMISGTWYIHNVDLFLFIVSYLRFYKRAWMRPQSVYSRCFHECQYNDFIYISIYMYIYVYKSDSSVNSLARTAEVV